MPASRQRTRLFYGLLAGCLLLLGQNAATLHAGDHDDGASRSAACAACAVVNLLSSACIDSGVAEDPQPPASGVAAVRQVLSASTEILTPRQRAPPRG